MLYLWCLLYRWKVCNLESGLTYKYDENLKNENKKWKIENKQKQSENGNKRTYLPGHNVITCNALSCKNITSIEIFKITVCTFFYYLLEGAGFLLLTEKPTDV